jgi:hypothetical protein
MPKTVFKNLFHFLTLILFVNLLAVFDLFIYLPRSIFYYEYILVFLALSFFKKVRHAYFLFCIIFILDIFDVISNIFLFDLSQLFSSLKFIFLYKFNLYHYLILFFVIFYIICLYLYLKYLKTQLFFSKTIFIKYLFLFYFIAIFLDVYNGSSKLIETNDQRKITSKNITSLLLKNYFDQAFQFLNNPVVVFNYNQSSITFESFKNDTTGNQLIILIESWGLINDSNIQEALQSNINTHINQQGYHFKWGKSKFSGSTASGELKQLLNLKGNYKYFLHHRSDTNNIVSIFDYKNKQGYTTYGFHCYSENMFNRSVWWKNIGIKNEYFKENYVKENFNKKIIIDDDGPFASITDVDMFNFMQLKIQNKNTKSFSYFLTENSHLPFKNIVNDNYPTQNLNFNTLSLSEEAKNQLIYIKNLLTIILQNLDTNKWQKVLIMGDHNPPYLNKNDRNFYSGKMVPYVLIYK